MKRQNSVFKPIVATSLALALGVSVVVAQPTIEGGSIGNITWSDNGGYDTTSTGTITAQTGVTTTLTSNKGIKITNGQDSSAGTLTINLGNKVANGTDFILNLNNINSSQYAFVGNLIVSGSGYDGNRQFQAIFGKNFKGNITLNSGGYTNADNPALIFNNGAKLEGDLTVSYEDTYIAFNGDGGAITGTLTKNSSGDLTIQFDSTHGGTINNFTRSNNGGTTNINNLTNIEGTLNIATGTNNLTFLKGGAVLGSSLNLSGGTLSYGFAEGVSTNNKTFSLDTLNQKVTITGGDLIFNGAKSVYFNNGNTNTTAGDGTLTLTGGSVKFVVDPTITSANQASQAIVKGGISATNASVIFALSDATNKVGSNPFTNPNATPPTDTYYVDGNITISNGGLSAFWDDSKGFVGKIATTSGHSLTFDATSGLSGKNDAWFDSGTFTTGKNTISSIQATLGTSHLVFEDKMTIGSGSGEAIKAQGGSSMILFKNNATINGNITALTSNSSNTIIARQNLIFDTGLTTINGGTKGINEIAINRFDISGTTTLNGNLSIYSASAYNDYANIAKNNIFKFGGSIEGSGKIIDVSAEVSNLEWQNGFSSRAKAILSFESSTKQTLTIDDINKQVSPVTNDRDSGFVYIGKDFTSGSGGTLGLNDAIFSDNSWSASSHQANLALTITNDMLTSNGGNYINVNELIANNITARGGTNNIVAQTMILKGALTASSKNSDWRNAVNRLTVNNLTFSDNAKINSFFSRNWLSRNVQRNNILTISDNISGTLVEMTAAKNTTSDQNGQPTYVRNVLSIEASTDQALTITSINNKDTVNSNGGATGLTYIGRSLTTGSGSTLAFNDSIFASGSTDPWSGENHRANLNLTSDSIYNNNQAVYINVKSLGGSNNGGTNIEVGGGSINIIASGGSSNALGTITATSGTSNIVLKGTSNSLLGDISATSGNNTITSSTTRIDNISISATRGVNNLTIDTLTEGSKIASMSISGDLNGRNNVTIKNSDLTIASGVTASGAWNSNGQNNINLQKTSATLTIESGGITTKKTSTEWWQDCVQQNNITFSNGGILTLTAGDISSQHYNQNNITFNGTNSGTITLSSGSIQATNNGRNNFFFSGSQNTINSSMTKSGGGQNNITYTANNATLTLQGATSQITKLTAYAPSSRSASVSTLVIDGSQRANNTTIDNVINGSNLVAKFNGNGTDKGATLKISAFAGNNNTLKAITLGDASTNNTLDLTALANTTITDAISVKNGQELNINLKNTTLTTSGWSNDEGGSSVINVGGNGVASANSTLQGGAVTLSGLNLNATTSTSMTLQNSSTTIGTLTSSASSTNGNKLILGFDSPDITTQTNNVSAMITNQVSGSNLTLVFNGGEDRSTSLTLNGANNTFKTIQLGSNANEQSTHNTLILNSGKTTIESGINVGNGGETQALAFTLKDSTELALTAGLATGTNGITTLRVEDATNGATLSGGAVQLTNLDMVSSANSSLTFKNTTTTINTLTSNATDTQINTLIMGEDSSDVTVNNTAKGTKFNLTFNDSTNTGAKTFTLTGGENTIQNVSVDANDTSTANTLAVTGGSTTITDAITIDSGKNLTLSLSSSTDTQNPSTTLVTLNNTFGGDGTKNVIFDGGVNPADQLNFSTLRLEGASNVLTSVTSNATNAKIELVNGVGATISNVTITSDSTPDNAVNDGGALTFAFVGSGNSQVTATNGITVGNGATLGISLGGSGNKTIDGSITFEDHSTLLVDFLSGNSANATITANNTANGQNGTAGISIGANRNSIINFHGTNTGSLNGSGITIDGGTNTINFIGSATMSGVTLSSGTNTINVYGKSRVGEAITGTIVTNDNQMQNVTNTINLEDYSTLKLLSDSNDTVGNGSLTSSSNSNTLNFLGEGAKLQGGFGADTSSGNNGVATINVGTDSTKTGISGLITGNVSGASIVFKGTLANNDSSKLTLQGATNTISSLTTSSNNGILVLDASNDNVNATVSNTSGMTINNGKSITIALHSEGTNNATFNVANGGITVNGTLGIAISGSGSGERTITASGGSNGITFNDNSTLRVDFLAGSRGSATLGGANKFEIDGGRNSEINFYAGSTATLAGGGLVLNGGTNTVNFYGNATLGQITLTSGANNINVKEGVTAKIESTDSALGSVNNTINLGDNSILQLEANTNTNNGDGSIVTTNTNELNFNGSNAILKGGFGAGSGRDPLQTGTATINVKNTGALITGNVTNAGVSFSEISGSTLTLQGATNTLNALSSTQNITGTVILDASKQANGVSAEITNAISGSGNVGLKFGSGGNAKTFKFSAQNNTLSGVEFDESGSTNNKIAFTNGSNTITNPFSITQGQGLTIALGDSTTTTTSGNQISLALTGGFSQEGGSATLRVEGQTTADALISGGEIDVGNLDMIASTSASLTLQNSSVTIGTLTAQNGSNTLKLDASNNAVNTTISNTLNGNNLTITLAGADATKTATLNLNGANNTISSLTLEASSTNNTLALNNGLTTISNDVSVDASQGISFNLASGTTLEFGGSNTFTNSAGTATFNIQGANTTLNGAINASGGTTTLSMIDGSSLTLTSGLSTTGGNTAINFAGTSSIVGDIATSNDSTATTIKLVNGSNASISGDITTTGTNANTTINYSAGNATLALKNGTQAISTLTLASNATNTLSLSNQANTTISNALALDNSNNLNVNIDENSSLDLASVTYKDGALNVNADGPLGGTLTLAGLIRGDYSPNDTNSAVNNTINVSTLNLNGDLSVNREATNTIKTNSITVSGNVISKNQGSGGSEMKNIIITNSIEFAGSGSNSVYAGHTGGRTSKNLFDISGDAKFSNGNLIVIANNNYADDSANRYKQNIFKLGGKVEGAIAELTATVEPDDTNTHNTANILSFEGLAPQSLTITDVNKASTISTQNDMQGKIYADGKSSNIYIGKNLTSGSGETLAFNSAFNDANWSDATYQANNLVLTIQNLNTNGGKNYINVGTLNVGDDARSGSISASDGGVNNIALGKNSKIKGNITSSGNGANNIVIQGSNATLTLEGNDANGTNHAITTLNAIGANTTLVLDNSKVTDGAMRTAINTLNGANLTATLKGQGTDKSATLALNGGTLKALTLEDGSKGNILDLSNATSEMSITNQVNVGKDQDLTIKFQNGSTLNLAGGLNTDGGTSKIALGGGDSASGTLTGGAVALSNLTLGATNSNTLTISSSSAVIDNITASGSTSNTLALNNTRTTIKSAINVSDNSNNPLSLEVNNSTLIFGSSTNTITSLTSNGGLVDLSQGVKPQTPYAMARGVVLASNGASARNTLTINDTFTGTATFKLYASKIESDRVVINGASSNPSQAIISVTGGNDVFSITESDNVVVATRADNSVEVVGGESYIGGARVGVTIGAKSDNTNTFIIKNAIELEADPVYQEVASSALAVNYDLYLANFNSLNKRMGELRNSEDSNGVWARVFGGAMSNDFGAGSKTQYVTAQAGYDYSLSVGENARNFIGIAVAYGTSDTKGNASYASSSSNAGLSLDKVSSNMVEVGLYNSYVADSGWYNDTIFKFDYIMSDFSLSNDPSTMSSTSNFAMVLSDEFGYRYSFGVSEKGSWYIDPQAEFAFGYFNQSDFNRAVDSLTNIKASQDAILTLRSRVGATLGKKFNTEKGFASLYVGASYEYDYIEGGSSGVSTRDGGLITQLDKVESNGRAVLNVGSNIELTKGARLYIDVEKSFGDKQRTFMQFNLGARYSF